MATAQDYNAVSRGLESITQAVLGNFMARRARELEDEEKRRFEQQRADQLAAQVAMRQDRERMRQLQEEQAAATAEERKANAAFRQQTSARLNRQEAAAALKEKRGLEGQAAYNAARLGSTVSPGMQSAADFLTSPDASIGNGLPATAGQSFTERPMDTSAQGIARAAATAGVGTPELDEKLAETAMRQQALTAKSGSAADVKPQPFRVTLENGAQVVGIHNPRTGAYHVFDGEKEIVAKQLKDDTGRPVPGKFYVPGPDGKPKFFDAPDPKPISTRELYADLRKLDEWEMQNPPESRVGNKQLGQQFLLNQRQRQMLMRTLDGLEGGGEEAPPGGATDQSGGANKMMPGAPAGKPAMKINIGPGGESEIVGGATSAPAATPPDDRDGGVPSAPPVAVQAAEPAVAPVRPSPARMVSENIGDLTDDDFTRTVRALPPDQKSSVSEALLEAMVRKLGIQPRSEHLRIGAGRLFQHPTSYVENLVNKPEFTAFWQSLPPDEKSALLKSALIGGQVTRPRKGHTVFRTPNYQ